MIVMMIAMIVLTSHHDHLPCPSRDQQRKCDADEASGGTVTVFSLKLTNAINFWEESFETR